MPAQLLIEPESSMAIVRPGNWNRVRVEVARKRAELEPELQPRAGMSQSTSNGRRPVHCLITGALAVWALCACEPAQEPSRQAQIDGDVQPLAADAQSPDRPESAVGDLLIPVAGARAEDLLDSYTEGRSGGRSHNAIDIHAPTGTPVIAAADGEVAKLFESKLGGLTVYQFDPSGQYVLYYAHLDGYASGLEEGDAVEQGEVIGYVGATGNAPVPHLHFSLGRLGPERRWWESEPVNPYPLLIGDMSLHELAARPLADAAAQARR